MLQPHILILSGSASRQSATGDLLRHVGRLLEAGGVTVDLIDLAEEPLPLFNPDTTYTAPHYAPLKARVERADVYLVGTPDYHGTVARQCYAWALPYAVTFVEKADMKEGRIASDALRDRIEMLVRDIRIYGGLLAAQRRADVAGTEPGFLAQMRMMPR